MTTQSENPTTAEQGSTGPERVRKAAVAAAQRLFAENGIHAVSVREIAREIGVSHTLLHLYFGSKDDIVREVLRAREGEYAAIVAAAPDAAAGVTDTFKAVANDREWLRVLAAGLIEGIAPQELEAYPTVQAAYAERFAGHERPADGVDYRLVGAATSAMLIGWAVAQDWLKTSAGLGDMSDEEFVDGLAGLLERLAQHC